AAAARPNPGAPLTAPRPPTPPPPIAPTPVPVPVARPVAPPPMPAPVTAPTTPAPVAARAPVIDETDFGELSAAPAASGDQDLWGNDAPLATSAPDENLWSSGGEKTPPPPATGVPMVSAPPADFMHPDEPQFVTNAAELANIEKFDGDGAPSGLDLDDAVPRGPKVRPGDDNLEGNIPVVPPGLAMTHEPTGEVPLPAGAPGTAGTAVNIPPEKLEAIVREVVQKMIGPILEKIAWEVVPDLAEDIIRDELKRLTGGAVQGSKTGTA
ncbi:MAG TPA: hypothetical protein VMV18_14145, partial [bacterium]|nr:hypothetical protein [bacterium]